MGVPTGMKEENIKAFFIFVIAWFLISMITHINSVYIYSYSSVTVQSLSHVQFFVTPWTADARTPCPSPTPEVHSNSCPLSW